MRLRENEKQAIIESADQLFPRGTAIYLFGSKADVNLKGGDIDLLVLSHEKINSKEIRQFKITIKEKIGDQKIDVTNSVLNTNDSFIKSIKDKAILLWES